MTGKQVAGVTVGLLLGVASGILVLAFAPYLIMPMVVICLLLAGMTSFNAIKGG